MRWLYLSLSLLIMLAGCETTGGYGPQAGQAGEKPVQGKYSRGEVSGAIENFFGVTAEAASEVVQSILQKMGILMVISQGQKVQQPLPLGFVMVKEIFG